MLTLVSIYELNQIVIGNKRAWIYPEFPRLPSGNIEKPDFTLPALKWLCKVGYILMIIIGTDMVHGIVEICFFSFNGIIASQDIKDLCVHLANAYSFSQIRTKLPEDDDNLDLLIATGFEHIVTMKDHLRVAKNKYENVIVLNLLIN